MKIPLSWLKEFINITHSPEELGEMLTMAGLEVDAIERDIHNDIIFDISLTPNLIHTASVFGVARELSALTGMPLHLSKANLQEDLSSKTEQFIKVTVENKTECPRYACRLIRNVKVAPSPEWLKNRLEACGMRTVNNIVDITNYVLIAYGHPLHAFDYNLIKDKELSIAHSKSTTITTLDETARTLTPSMLTINDGNGPIAIAGIMGGNKAEVSLQTTDVLLESAYFYPSSIRKTSKQLFLSTEASRHFERGCDPEQVLASLDFATALITEIAGGTTPSQPIDIKEHAFLPKTITCRLSRINALLGTTFSFGEVQTILQKLECPITFEAEDRFHVQVPTYRGDIHAEVDIIEEVARIYGYNNLPKSTAKYQTSTLPHAPAFLFENKIREKLLAQGLQEFLTCDLISPQDSALIQSGQNSISVLNPTSIQQSVLRTSLLPGLLRVIKHNLDHQSNNIHGFEVGRTHFKNEEQYKEISTAGIILCGSTTNPHFSIKSREMDFYDLKGIVENLLEALYFNHVSFKASHIASLHPGRQSALWIDSSCIATFGEVHPALLRQFNIPAKVLFAEINLHNLFQADRKPSLLKPLPQFPASERDWTVTLQDSMPIEHVLSIIKKQPHTILENVELIALYKSEKLGKHLKNATFHFTYRNTQKTLSFDEVEKEHESIVQSTIKELL